MRRNDREITDLNEILSTINDCKVIRLAMIDAGEPYLLPLNFGYTCENGLFSFFCHSAREGRKLDILRKNPTVAFEMDCRGALDEQDVACRCGYYFASVTGVGHVEFLDGAEKLAALTALMPTWPGARIRLPKSRPVRSRSSPFAPTSSAPRQGCLTARSESDDRPPPPV